MRSEAAMTTRPRLRVVKPGEVRPEVAREQAQRSARRVMATLVVSTAALTMIGLVMVLSASSVRAFADLGSSFFYFKRQLVFAAAGLVGAVGAYRMRYQVWRKLWVPFVAASAALLVLVLNPRIGSTVGGAARWIQIGSFSLQPSELAKFAVVTMAAALLARNYRFLSDPVRMLTPVALILGGIAGLILLQPDFGTTMVIAVTVGFLVFVVGVRLRFLIAWLAIGSGAGLAVIMGTSYMRVRFLSFLHPWADPQNTGYQVIQGLIALGSGHLYGVGLGASRQKWLFLPNAHTDFIFAILGEEVGLIGEIVVLALFGAFLYAGIRIALKAPDTFGRLLAAGILTWLGFQALVNLGGVTGVLPITGVPLPFLSYGGSSLVVTLTAVGVLASIGRAGLWPERDRRPVRRGAGAGA